MTFLQWPICIWQWLLKNISTLIDIAITCNHCYWKCGFPHISCISEAKTTSLFFQNHTTSTKKRLMNLKLYLLFRSIKCLLYFLFAGANPSDTISTGQSALHTACVAGSLAIVNDLVSHGADLAATTNIHQTALHFAATSNQCLIAEYLIDKWVLFL